MGEGITQQNLQDNHQKVSNGVLFATIPSFREIHSKSDENCSVFGLSLKPSVDYKIHVNNLKHIEKIAETYGVGYDMIEGSGHEFMLVGS
ncbi:hypothetical protein RhiirA1_472644 [Rhizophagus irregularis]|uniref:Uncharacterized protein n=1 Tax=Rhizophagus irregularis TaxID=588596 RepID=A0A2N0R210_9GLOM|nr:hypothetical protein RhiirA1_472644 [Rhizophagus irregularis]